VKPLRKIGNLDKTSRAETSFEEGRKKRKEKGNMKEAKEKRFGGKPLGKPKKATA